MMSLLLEVSARVVLLAAGVALTLAAMRIRSPRVAHRAWVGAALVMIALPLVVAWGPVVAIPVAVDTTRWTGDPPRGVAVSVPGSDVALGGPAAVRADSPAAAVGGVRGTSILLAIYLAGALGFLARILVGIGQASMLRRQATVVQGRLTSTRCSTPITVGLCTPVVILPRGWTSWPDPELASVLAHEQEHRRCRDPLATLATLVARALFWFHPLAWWLHRHVATLAEQACDAAVVAHGHDPDLYAASLVKFARAQAAAGRRVATGGIAMGGLALERRLRLLQNPALARTGRARLLAVVMASAWVAGLCGLGTPVGAMAVEPQVQVHPSPAQPPAPGWQAGATEHFEIYAADEYAHVLADVARQAEEAYAELSAAFRYDLPERVPLVLVGGEVRLRDATITIPAAGHVPPSNVDCELAATDGTFSGQCAVPGLQAGRQVIVLALESFDQQRRLIVHELTHRFAFDIAPGPSRDAPWLIEGLAEHHRGVWNGESVRAVRDAVAGGWVPEFDALAGAERYWTHALFDFIADTYGAEGMRRYLFALRTRPRGAEAIPAAFATTAAQFNAAFRRYVSGRFGTL
jgi:beta-lactamase regulating signal transducer with metallopeptidase domain